MGSTDMILCICSIFIQEQVHVVHCMREKICAKKFACTNERLYHITHTRREIKLAQAQVVLT